MRSEVEAHPHHLTSRACRPRLFVFDDGLKSDAFGTHAGYASSNTDLLVEIYGSFIRDVHIRDDHAKIKEALPIEKPQVLIILKACLLNIGEKACVIDMPLRVQILITHLDRCIEFEFVHAPIITEALARLMIFIYTYIWTIYSIFTKEVFLCRLQNKPIMPCGQ